jgi:hypothetical protein
MNRQFKFFSLYALTFLAVLSVAFAVPTPASADGAEQISGIAYFDAAGDCADPEGAGSDFGVIMTGDLEGCLYIFVESATCTPSGVYLESGSEIFVGQGGTFRTTYRIEQKYQDCPNLTGQIIGRCQHPIIAGSGTGEFEGVTGRLDFKDDIEAGNFPYRGHLR